MRHLATAWIMTCAAALCAPAMAASSAPAAPSSASATDAQGAAAPIDDSEPAKLIQTAAIAMLKELDAHRAEYHKDASKIYHLVDQVLLPHFDVEYAAKLVLGRHWSAASEEQRKRFINAFYKSLLMNYGDAIANFTGDRLKVFPYTGDAGATNATVRSQVRKDDGNVAAVNYSLHRVGQVWKAWDVVIEGISYVKSFRDDFGAEIDQKGLDSVIQRLEKGDTPAAIKSTTSKG
jgi:phospholipid transport system substrate-binding protein